MMSWRAVTSQPLHSSTAKLSHSQYFKPPIKTRGKVAYLDVSDVLTGKLQGVDETGTCDNGGAVLVVVHDGDVDTCLCGGAA